jgi:hypothetical protein
MFVRKKKNRSGSVSVVIVSKERGKFRELQMVGVSSEADEIARLYREGQIRIREQAAMGDLFESHRRMSFAQESAHSFFNNIESVLLNGTQLIRSMFSKSA